ncbi:MAG: HAD family hydrolase [Nocardioidaceae bacterium]
MTWDEFDAVLFDLDGVLTPTAEVHMHAWETMFSAFLAARGERPYATADYFAHIDGKPRYDGVRAFLASRDIVLPEGDPSDSTERETVCGLGNRKDELFSTILAQDGVRPYPGSVAYLDELATRGKQVAVVSSSRNAPAVLEAAGIADRFEVVVDGRVAGEQGLQGKPSAETFAYAARQLDTSNERSVVVEDALSGVEAGNAGAFGLVIGVDRGAGADALRKAGADIVVKDLEELVTQGDTAQ